MNGRSLAAAAGAWLVLAPLAADAPQEQPRESGLVERTGSRLVQLDVTLRGPRGAIEDLGAEDFELAIGGRPIVEFTLDNLCRLPPPAAAPPPAEARSEPAAPPAEAPTPRRPPATFLFYFDQPQLTLAGRQHALETAHELAQRLIVDGNRAMVVSAGREVRVFRQMTSDVEQVLQALDEIANDRSQWDPQEAVFGNEELHIEEVVNALNHGDIDRALGLARQYQREETWRTGKTLRLFSLALGGLSEVDPPKAVLYFADKMRSNAGAHYMSFFGSHPRSTDEALMKKMELDAFSSSGAFQKVIEEASANGVRLYTIQAEGLVSSSPRLTITQETRSGTASATYNSQRIRDAQNSLVGLAQETGGEAFLNGVRAAKIATAIEEDLACLYLISFDPTGLPENRDLPVSLRVDRKKVDLRVKGVLVVQSEEARRASRLLAAFAAPEAVTSDLPVLGAIVPTGYADGKFTALVQLAVPGSPLAGTTWDLGLSLVSRGRVREDASGRVSVSGAGVPVIFETQMSFAPGPFELISVVHEVSADAVSTGRLEGVWPDPDDESVTVGPIAVVQPAEGVFLRDTERRLSGSRAVGPREAARVDLPTALIGIVCRGPGKHQVRLQRVLAGESSAEFPEQEIDLGRDRCAIFADRIPAGTMTAGGFRYEVRVVEHDVELTSAVREFAATGGQAQPASAAVARDPA